MKRSFIQKTCAVFLIACASASVQANAQALSGPYTINPGLPASATNFQSFGAAATALNTNGVAAPVTFTIAAGTYNEQVLLNTIAGTSATNTVTFNGTGATLSANPTNTNSRAIIKLNGADYVRINGLSITATGSTTSEYGYGIQLMNGADYNTITGCTISATKTTDGTVAANYAGIVLSSSDGAVLTLGNANCNFNTIQNNTISGGYYGIAFVAQATTYTINGNRILNNNILDFYRTGIYLNGTVNTIVDNNDISRPGRPGPPFFQYFGLNIDGGNSGMQITRNKMHDPFGENSTAGSSAYAMYINGSAGDAAAENLYANNIIYNMRSSGIVGGFDITSSPYNRFVNNTISIDDVGATGFGFTKGFSLTGANNQTIYNNNISINRGGLGAKHCIYVGSTTNSSINNNNYHMVSGTNNYVGYFASANRTTLGDWQAASGFDGSSISTDPQFTNTSVGNLLPINTALQTGAPTANTGISTDINGLGRNAITPTMGAFEINGTVLPVRMSLLAGKLDQQQHASLGWSTYAELNNAGFAVQTSADGKTWGEMGFVATKAVSGNSESRIDYTFNGAEVTARQYFRLAQLDKDGQRSYSNVLVLQPGTAAAVLTANVYPNPAAGVLHLELQGNIIARGTVVICDLSGTKVVAQVMEGAAVTLDIQALAPGMYFLQYNNGTQSLSLKFLKRK